MAKGRKGLYEDYLKEDGLILLEGWARDGLTDKQIAEDKIGINESTLCRWKNDHPPILQALKRGKAPVDYKVENATLKAALGYKVTVRKPIKLREEKQLKDKGKIVTERIEYVDEEIYIPPQSVNQFFWLKNRLPDKWRDKQVIESNAEGQLAQLIDGLKEPEKGGKDGK